MKPEISLYQQRRQSLMNAIAANGGGVAILFTAPEVMRNRDSDYPYRHDSYFYYLSGFSEPEACLVLLVSPEKGQQQSLLFCRNKNLEREIWDGHRYGPQTAQAEFGFHAAFAIEQLDEELPKLLANQHAIYYALASHASLDQRIQNWLTALRQQSRTGTSVPNTFHDIRSLLDEMRLFKDPSEIALMQQAANISASAHLRAMQTVRPGMFEYEIEAELLHEFRRQGSEFPAYGSIVAGGANACVLHYRENTASLQAGDLLLIDAGCEYHSYASDITRTFPVNGRFSTAQRDLYEIVLAAQHAALACAQPGKRFNDPHDAALRVLAQGLLDTGLLQGTVDGALESGSYRQFYMHRTSHWLGMDVHDCGEYRGVANQPLDERPWRKLEAGMVLTVEPGLYVRPADNVPKDFWNIGIRIEDDVLITVQGHTVLSAAAPKTASAIESLMQSSL